MLHCPACQRATKLPLPPLLPPCAAPPPSEQTIKAAQLLSRTLTQPYPPLPALRVCGTCSFSFCNKGLLLEPPHCLPPSPGCCWPFCFQLLLCCSSGPELHCCRNLPRCRKPFHSPFHNCLHSPTAMGCDCTNAPAAAAKVSDGPASSGAGGAHNTLGCWDGTGMPCSCAQDSTKLRSVQLVCMHVTSRRMHGSRKHSASQWRGCTRFA